MIVKLKSVHVYSGRRLHLRESTELSSFETGSRSEGSFLPRLRPVRVPATREDLRHNCNYASLAVSDYVLCGQYRSDVL